MRRPLRPHERFGGISIWLELVRRPIEPWEKLREVQSSGAPRAREERDRMAKSILYMSMSLDGFIAGPDAGPGNGLGNGGQRLHEWLGQPVSRLPHFAPPGLSGQLFG